MIHIWAFLVVSILCVSGYIGQYWDGLQQSVHSSG